MKKTTVISCVTLLLGFVIFALPNAVLADSAAGDFSSSSNPNGVWSYGWLTTLGSAFNLDTISTNSYQGSGLSGWMGNQNSDGTPFILYNGTTNTLLFPQYSPVQPGQLFEHPDNGNYAVVCWTAPSSGQFSISATFSGLSPLGDSVDVHVLDDSASIFDSTVIGSPSPVSYSGVLTLAIGDTVEFAVGDGGNGKNEDATALSVTIQSVPEPNTIVLTMGGLLGLLCFRRRSVKR